MKTSRAKQLSSANYPERKAKKAKKKSKKKSKKKPRCTSKVESDYILPKQGPFPNIPTPPGPHLAALVEGLKAWTVGIKQYETSYAIRFTRLVDTLDWNCAAIYSTDWKDALTKKNKTLVHAPPTMTILASSNSNIFSQEQPEIDIELHNSDTRLLCMANAWATVVKDWVPEAEEAMMNYIQAFQYPGITDSGYNPQVKACFDKEGNANMKCLTKLAEDDCFAPSIMGAIVAQQVSEYARRDGFNMYGEMNRNGSECIYNCRRYTDPTNYSPVYDMKDPDMKTHWRPLLEDNSAGFFTRQEHVAPHMGFLAKPAILSCKEIDKKEVASPDYDYDKEAVLVAQRMANLTDEKKILVEFFDDKISVAFAIIGAVAMKGVSFEHILNFAVGYTSGDYDATILAWKEKVKHDLVRPTTWIQDQMPETEFQTWVKGMKGIQTLRGKDFESFVRVMPHSEHVSGSGCIFQTVYEYTDEWIEEYLGMTDSMSVYLGDFEAGSSMTEPGMTPATKISLSVSSLMELRDIGGQSRLDGGMHFTDSVTASYELCKGVGHAAAMFAFDLW